MCKAVIASPCSPALGGTVRTDGCSSPWVGWQVWSQGLDGVFPFPERLFLTKGGVDQDFHDLKIFLGWVPTTSAPLNLDFERCIIIVVISYVKEILIWDERLVSSHSVNAFPKFNSSVTWASIHLFILGFNINFNFLMSLVVVGGGIELMYLQDQPLAYL